MPYVGTIANIPNGWALCNGSNGTPNLTGRFLEGVTSASLAKQTKAAGLPNITGEFGYFNDYNLGYRQKWHLVTGPFYISSVIDKGVCVRQDPDLSIGIGFDASKCSSLYKNDCTTVQPNSYTVMYIMKIK